MPPKKRHYRLRRISEEERPNELLSQLSSDDFILDSSPIVFSSVLPEYEVMVDKVEEIEDLYNEAVLDFCEETQQMLSRQRECLKELVLKENSEIKIPKTPKAGRNASKIVEYFENCAKRRNKVTKKNLFNQEDISYDNVAETPRPGMVADLRSKFANMASGTTKLVPNSKNAASTAYHILAATKKNRDTTERAFLLQQQDNSLRRAVKKKDDLLKEKAERAKKEREEKTKQAEERRRLREQEREEKIKEKKIREERVREFENQKKTPKTLNSQCFKTPTSTVSRPKIVQKNTIDETPLSQMGMTYEQTSISRTIVDKSCDISEIPYETPLIPRKRKSGLSRKDDLFASPVRKQHRLLDTENVTPDLMTSYIQTNISKPITMEQDNFVKFEEKMKSLEVPDMFSSPLNISSKANASLIQCVEYELTPDKVPQPSTEDDYNIADLSEGDGTDDEDNPKKDIPHWARMESLRSSLKSQHKKFGQNTDLALIFGKINEFKVENVFKGRHFTRSSSAIWHSPAANPTQGKSIYHQLNGSIVDSSFIDD